MADKDGFEQNSHEYTKDTIAVKFPNFKRIFNFFLIITISLTILKQMTVPVHAGVEIIAKVNGKPITNYDLNQRIAFLIAVTNMQVNEGNRNRIKNDALQMLIDEKIKLGAAQKLNPNITLRSLPMARKLIDTSFQRNGKSGIEVLNALNLSVTAIQQKFLTDIVWTSLVRSKFASKFGKIDARANVELERIKKNAMQAQILLSEIVLLPKPNRSLQQTLIFAKEIITAVNNGANFNAIAQQYSVSGSAQNGGRTGWNFANRLSEEVVDALNLIKVGNMTTPIQRDGAVYIFKKEGTRQEGKADSNQDKVWLTRALIPLPETASKADKLEAASRLERDTENISSCTSLLTLHESYGSNMKSTLDNIIVRTLTPEMRVLTNGLKLGVPSSTLSFAEGVAIFMLCKREKPKIVLPELEEIKSALLERLFGSLGERYLLQLRRSSIIERN